jgi:hypothetical protein
MCPRSLDNGRDAWPYREPTEREEPLPCSWLSSRPLLCRPGEVWLTYILLRGVQYTPLICRWQFRPANQAPDTGKCQGPNTGNERNCEWAGKAPNSGNVEVPDTGRIGGREPCSAWCQGSWRMLVAHRATRTTAGTGGHFYLARGMRNWPPAARRLRPARGSPHRRP